MKAESKETKKDDLDLGCNDPLAVTTFLNEQKGETFVDVGASDGFYTIGLAKNWKRIYAFEPYALTAKFLRMRVRKANLSRVDVREKAIIDKEGIVSLHLSPRGWRCHSLYPVGESCVETMSSTLAKEFPHEDLDLVKVDVEGKEFEVVEGAREIMPRIAAWLIEVHDLRSVCGTRIEHKETYNQRLKRMEKLMKSFGYRTRWIATKKAIYAYRE